MKLPGIWKLIPRALRQRLVLGRIKAALTAAGLPKLKAEEIMRGWKTWAGGLSLIGAGIAAIAATVASGDFNMDQIMKGFGMVGAGFAALGIGAKIEKNADAVKVAVEENTAAVKADTAAVKADTAATTRSTNMGTSNSGTR